MTRRPPIPHSDACDPQLFDPYRIPAVDPQSPPDLRPQPLRVFVVGASRGGTTLVQRLLAERLDLHTMPETQFFAQAVGGSEARRFPRTARHPSPVRRATSRLRQSLGLACGTWDRLSAAASDWTDALDVAAVDRAGWVEKTPFHVHYVPEIMRYVPGAQIVHVVRDPRATIASIMDAAAKHPDPWAIIYDRVERAADAWSGAMLASARMVGEPRQIFVSYEALCRSPDAMVEAIARRMGAEVTTARRRSVRLAGEGQEPWKAEASGDVRRASSKWAEALSDDERARAEPMIARLPDALEAALAGFAAAARFSHPHPVLQVVR